METVLKQMAADIDIQLSDKQIEKFFMYKKILKEWNEKINLTAIIDDKEIIIKHFIDSIIIEKYIPQNAKMIDVGTGAGFPGIPIKIIRPDVEITLLDSLNKRVNFLNEVIKQCKLEGITALHGRAEDIAQNVNYREKYDVSTARAVANIATLLEYCTPFVKVGGSFICMKSEAEQEISDAEKAEKILQVKKENVKIFTLPEIEAKRTLIIYKKIKNTLPKYPRKAGIPAKEPIK